MKKTTVLLVCTSNLYSNGSSKCLIELAVGLTERGYKIIVSLPRKGEMENVLRKRGIDYYIIREAHYDWLLSENEKVSYWKKILTPIINHQSKIRYMRIIKKEKVDVVHINALSTYVAAEAASSNNIPLVWHIREFIDIDLHKHFASSARAIKIINKADIGIAISETIKKKWEKQLNLPIKVIYDGLPIDNYYIANKSRSDEIRILLYGRICKGKGQEFYVKCAIDCLSKMDKAVHFFFAGTIEDEKYFEEINNLINGSQHRQKITYLGNIDNVKEMLFNTDVVCVCSQSEGFGRVTVEAMLGECVVLGADTGATTELITEGINGFIYREGNEEDFINKLLWILDNYDSLGNLVETAQKMAKERFSIESDLDRIIELYNEVLEGR